MTATATAATVTVGTVFARSYGYDETHVAFYEITEVSKSGKSGKARKIRSASAGTDTVVASTADERFDLRQGCARCSNFHEDEPAFDGHEFTLDYTWQARFDRLTVTSYGDHAYRWDGKPMYVTGFGFGH